MRKNLTKNFLEREYIVKRKCTRTIARETGWSQPTVIRRLIKYSIKLRNIWTDPIIVEKRRLSRFTGYKEITVLFNFVF